MKCDYTIKEEGDLVLLVATTEPTGNPLKTYKFSNSYAKKIMKKEGYNVKLLKPRTHVTKHDEKTETVWKFKKILSEVKEVPVIKKPTARKRTTRKNQTKKQTTLNTQEE